ncbi:hypothetical protein V8E54_014172 [Elaphomyces granulatus]
MLGLEQKEACKLTITITVLSVSGDVSLRTLQSISPIRCLGAVGDIFIAELHALSDQRYFNQSDHNTIDDIDFSDALGIVQEKAPTWPTFLIRLLMNQRVHGAIDGGPDYLTGITNDGRRKGIRVILPVTGKGMEEDNALPESHAGDKQRIAFTEDGTSQGTDLLWMRLAEAGASLLLPRNLELDPEDVRSQGRHSFLELSPARSYFPPELEASGIPLGEGRSDRPLADRREDGFAIPERIAYM